MVTKREQEIGMQVVMLLEAKTSIEDHIWLEACDDFFSLNRMAILNILQRELTK